MSRQKLNSKSIKIHSFKQPHHVCFGADPYNERAYSWQCGHCQGRMCSKCHIVEYLSKRRCPKCHIKVNLQSKQITSFQNGQRSNEDALAIERNFQIFYGALAREKGVGLWANRQIDIEIANQIVEEVPTDQMQIVLQKNEVKSIEALFKNWVHYRNV